MDNPNLLKNRPSANKKGRAGDEDERPERQEGNRTDKLSLKGLVRKRGDP